MIHPSHVAESIVFDRFMKVYCDDATISLSETIEKLLKRIEHRPMVPNSLSYRKHVKETISMIEELETKHPYLQFTEEKQLLLEKLTNN